jgi:hypothetical protein
MSQTDKSRYFYAKIPKRLLQSYSLLNPTDRAVLTQIISWYPNECFYAVNYFTEKILGVGDKAFYQSIYKLQFLGLIRFKRGNRKRPNRYLFVADPRDWRLPKPLCDQIRADHLKLGFEDFKCQHEPFPNEYGFKVAFNKIYPKYAIKIQTTEEVSSLTDTSVAEPIISEEDKLWVKKYENIDGVHASATRTVADYYKYQLVIAQAKTKLDTSPHQKKYLLRLEEKFFEISYSPPDEIVKKILALATELESKGLSPDDIQEKLLSESKALRQKQNI